MKNKFLTLCNKGEKDQLDRVLDKTGKIIKINELTKLNKELDLEQEQSDSPIKIK